MDKLLSQSIPYADLNDGYTSQGISEWFEIVQYTEENDQKNIRNSPYDQSNGRFTLFQSIFRTMQSIPNAGDIYG